MKNKTRAVTFFNMGLIDQFDFLFSEAMDGYQISISILDQGIKKAEEGFEASISNDLEELDDLSEDEKSKWLADNYIIELYRDTVPGITWQSLLMSVFGMFEFYLAIFCSSIALIFAKSASISVKNEFHPFIKRICKPKKSYVKDSRTFLERLFPNVKPIFREHEIFIENLSFIRNSIAHNGGYLPAFGTNFYKGVKRFKRLSESRDDIGYSDYKHIEIKPEFVEYSITTLLEIFEAVHSVIKNQSDFLADK